MPAKKKDPSVRARRNKASTAATITRPTRARTPALPKRAPGVVWHAMTRQWWKDVWASPMAPEWDESDVHNVYVLAAIYDDIWAAETPRERQSAAVEYRLQRVDLGLSPYSRRRLEWTIESADEAKDRGAQRRQSRRKPAGPVADPRSVLSAVK